MDDLTLHQVLVLNRLLGSDSKIVALVGSAGVGKSVSISEFIKRHRDVVGITGTTHRAVANINEMLDGVKVKFPARTIHSFLGMRMVNRGTQTFLKPIDGYSPNMDIDYLIIDEMSMLTTQLMARIDEYIELNPRLKKVILIGDPIQLRLPGSSDLVGVPVFELTEQMRQSGAPYVAKALSKLRIAIESDTELTEAFEEGEDLIVYDDHYLFLKAYKESEKERMILMFQNKTVKSYNDNIKTHYLGHDSRFSVGDIVYPTSPIIIDKKVRITNRQQVKIIKVDEHDHHYSLHTAYGTIKVTKAKQVLKDYLQSLADNNEWKEFYELKETFADVHHTWAGTSHSAQGMSVDEVFVDFTDIQGILNMGTLNDMYRALYVAMSRCKSKVHIYIGDDRVYKALGKYQRRK